MTTNEKNESKSSEKQSKKSAKRVIANVSEENSNANAESKREQSDSRKNSVSNHVLWDQFNKTIKSMLLARGETRVDGWRVPILRNDKQLTVIVVHPNARETKQVFSFNELKLAGLWKSSGKRPESKKALVHKPPSLESLALPKIWITGEAAERIKKAAREDPMAWRKPSPIPQ